VKEAHLADLMCMSLDSPEADAFDYENALRVWGKPKATTTTAGAEGGLHGANPYVVWYTVEATVLTISLKRVPKQPNPSTKLR
jgi:hypothetical protein